ncbi:MAG: hypothetical protein F6K44_24935 [Moorea sp. SIO3E2]|uniref:hypothetical protein n=1 Tax=Moorena sp. SIO4E2 TaxID=2607826 RepID=UPI0013BC49CF|nr:hypothetical protein [Moorena sp. SIO4E2]NEQ05361.1 hypothetical protein [Moorena sp. SIO4E2]NEQ16835.1 hypothetical protein [Moorena sp. SIO3E2]NES46503.1 hypothetical protein [Moorena sp. SIO2C4]
MGWDLGAGTNPFLDHSYMRCKEPLRDKSRYAIQRAAARLAVGHATRCSVRAAARTHPPTVS